MLYDVSGKPGFIPGKFSFACINGICLVSPSSMLVEESIQDHSLGRRSASADEELSLIRETAGRYVMPISILTITRLTEHLFYPYIEETTWGDITEFSRLATWGELDLDVKKVQLFSME